jgi:hypothetical protein
MVFASPTVQIFEIGSEIRIDENSETKRLPVDISSSQGGMITLTCESSNFDLVSHASFYLDYINSHIITTTLSPPITAKFIPLVIFPNENKYGRSTITLRIEDENNDFDTVSFDLVVNGRPRISPIADYAISNLSLYHIDFVLFDPETSAENLDITILSSLPDVLPSENISLSFPNQDSVARLTLDPIKGATGVVQVTMQVSDKRLITQQSFQVDIQSLPVLFLPTQWTIPFNSHSAAIPMSICDADGGSVTLTIESTDLALVRNEKISIESSHTNSMALTLDNICHFFTFSVQPEQNRIGDVVLKFVMNNGLFIETQELLLTVLNTSPQITSIPSLVTNMNTLTEPVSFSVTDAEGGWITLTCISEHLMNISFCSSQGTYTRFYLGADEIRNFSGILIPEPNFFGRDEFTIHITDGFLSESTSFSATVNYPPLIIEPGSQIINKNTISSPIAITVIDKDTPLDNLSFSFVTNCPALFNESDIDYICTSTPCTLLLTPVTNQSGTCQISVNVSDGIGSNVTPIQIRVNEQPYIDPIAPQESDEDQSLTVIANVSDDDLLSTHQWSLTFSNPQLVASYDIQRQLDNHAVLLSFYPLADMSGQTTVTVSMSDPNYLSYSRTFIWQVMPVEDLPKVSGFLSEYRIEENSSLTLTIQLLDPDTPVNELDLIVSNTSNHALIPKDNIYIQSLDNKRIIRIVPQVGELGHSTIIFKVFNSYIPESFREYPVDLTVYPKNAQPVISSDELTLNEDTVIQYRIKGSDADEDPLRYEIEKEPSRGRIMHFNQDTGLFTYVPFENIYGIDTMQVKAFDNINYSEPTLLTFTVLPINDAPVAYDDKYVILTNQAINIHLQASDIDSQDIVYRLTNESITFGEINLADASKGIVSYTPPKDKIGQDHVWFFAKDSSGLVSNIGTITIRIENQQHPEYTLTVNMAGEYNTNDPFEYAILDAADSEEVVSGSSRGDQFVELLQAGSYQLIIIAQGYEPYEYSVNTNRMITINDSTEISCYLKRNDNFKPYKPSVQVSKTSIANGFILRVEKINFDDQFVMKINGQDINTGEETWPYMYKWTVGASPFTVSSTVQPYTVDKYNIDFEFYNWKTYVDTYSVTFYDLDSDESKNYYRTKDRVAFETPFGYGGAYGSTALYETEGYSYFYPLMGSTINLWIQSGTGGYTETQINIPKIPLNYLIIDDPQNWEYNEDSDYYDVYQKIAIALKPSDRLKVKYSHYAFFITIASGIAIEFEMADGPNAGKTVRYNPFLFNDETMNYERFSHAPKINIPILLNANYNKFDDFSEALLGLMDTFPALVNEIGDGALLETENGDLVEKFQRLNMPFFLQDKMIVYLQANHLTRFAALWSIPVDDEDVGLQYFHADSIDDGGCFIQELLFRNAYQAY